MSDQRPDTHFEPLDDRLVDLVVQRATCGLSREESAELAALLVHANRGAIDELDRAVDALRRGLDAAEPDATDDEMPASVRAGILARGVTAKTSTQPQSDRMNFELALARARQSAKLGWIVAGAAVVIFGVLWLATLDTRSREDAHRVRIADVESAPDLVRYAFTSADAAATGATGEVVWSDERQKGFVRLRGVAPNDAAKKQYQLWIVDSARDERPIDAGVFNVASADAASGDVVVTFRSSLPVAKPGAFAITSEKPGGVVVTAGPILLLAKPTVAPQT